jgi:hypothetical protein
VIACTKCGADLGGFKKKAASITLRPMGMEETRSFFLCKACDVYTAHVCIEPAWEGGDTIYTRGPIARDKGDKIVARIKECGSPDNKSCQCPVHREMEGKRV